MDDQTVRGQSDRLAERDALIEAMSEREGAGASVRKVAAILARWSDDPQLQEQAGTTLVRERVSRVRYAEQLKASGWPVPPTLLSDTYDKECP